MGTSESNITKNISRSSLSNDKKTDLFGLSSTNKKINFYNYCVSKYQKNVYFKISKKTYYVDRYKINQILSNKTDIEVFASKIGDQNRLPFGIFSFFEKLTNSWNLKERWKWLVEQDDLIWGDLELSVDNLNVIYRAFGGSDEDSAAIKGDYNILNSNSINYFEIKILNTGREGFIGIGLTHTECDLDRLPGWEKFSIGYHGDDGHLFDCSGTGTNYGPKFSKGDIIGVCWNLIENTVFFTKNGNGLSFAFGNFSWFNLPLMVPIIGLRSEGESITANFGGKFFEFNIKSYFDSFLKYRLPKIILMGKLEFMRKRKLKENLCPIVPKKYNNLSKSIKILINSVIQKEKREHKSNIKYIKFYKRIFTGNPGLNHLKSKIYFKTLDKIFKSISSKFKSKLKIIIERFFSLKNIKKPFLEFFLNYLIKFENKNEYFKDFKKNINKFASKKHNLNDFFRLLSYKSTWDPVKIHIGDISYILTNFKPNNPAVIKS